VLHRTQNRSEEETGIGVLKEAAELTCSQHVAAAGEMLV
jgi:hypothetical protein